MVQIDVSCLVEKVENSVGGNCGYQHFLFFSPYEVRHQTEYGQIQKFELCTKQHDFRLVLVKVFPCSRLTHYQMTKFRLFQTERVCRRQFQI